LLASGLVDVELLSGVHPSFGIITETEDAPVGILFGVFISSRDSDSRARKNAQGISIRYV